VADQEFEGAFRSNANAEKTTDEPLIRVMALHALAYCERLFYLEEVEEIRVADHNVYAGRRLHDEIDKGPDIYQLELGSGRLGIRGKLDVAKREGGHLVVIEHKKGKSGTPQRSSMPKGVEHQDFRQIAEETIPAEIF